MAEVTDIIDAELVEDPLGESRVEATLNEELRTTLGVSRCHRSDVIQVASDDVGPPTDAAAASSSSAGPAPVKSEGAKRPKGTWREHVTVWKHSVRETTLALELVGEGKFDFIVLGVGLRAGRPLSPPHSSGPRQTTGSLAFPRNL